MLETPQVSGGSLAEAQAENPTSEPCVMLVFGASGDLTKRLLVPALYNLECDGLLSENFALLGTAMDRLHDRAVPRQNERGHHASSTPAMNSTRPAGISSSAASTTRPGSSATWTVSGG